MEADDRALRHAFIRHLVANVQCVACGERYARNDIYVLGHHEDVWVSAVVCSHCGTQGLVFATLRSEEEFQVQAEPGTAQPLPPLTIDDVLDMHALLRDHDGDLLTLLGTVADSAES